LCNLYSMTKNVDAIRRLFGALNSRVGNLPTMPGIFPDYPAPIVRNAPDGREIVMARWGMPSSSKALMEATKKRAQKLEAKGKTVDFKELLRMEPEAPEEDSITQDNARRLWAGALDLLVIGRATRATGKSGRRRSTRAVQCPDANDRHAWHPCQVLRSS